MITEFTGEYRFLSNFYQSYIFYKGRKFSSVEHAYQSEKSNDKEWKDLCASPILSPGKIKLLSQSIELIPRWEFIKVSIMEELLKIKFSDAPMKRLLLKTGNEYLREGNTWGDTFWGYDTQLNQGENILGELLMEIRESLK